MRFQLRLLTLLLVVYPQIGSAENWPGWRGPRGDGSSRSQAAPVTWNGVSGDHVRWKLALPGEGLSSPIVWNDQIYVTACDLETKERMLLCVDRGLGKLRWQRRVVKALLESKHTLNSYATSTPVTDGESVFVSFLDARDEEIPAPNVGSPRMIHPGEIVTAAFDLDGNRKWLVRPGGFVSAHGFASSPVLFEDFVIINGDHDGESYIVALDKQTGEVRWKTSRAHGIRSYVTPLLRNVAGQPQMVLSGSQRVAAFDPTDGHLVWHVEGPTEQFVASMVFDGSLFFAVGGFPTHHVIAIRPTGAGDVSRSHVAWHQTNVRCYVPSPAVVDQFLIVADDRGTANCFDTRTGKRLWQTRMGKHYSASLITANKLVYFVADDGTTKLLRPGPEPDVLFTNELGENTYASPALAHDELFLRGEQHLFCIAPQ